MQNFKVEDLDVNLRAEQNLANRITSNFQEEVNDSGLDSINLPGLNFCKVEEPDEIVSLEKEFLKIQIDKSHQICPHDSGVYTSSHYDSSYNSDVESSENICEKKHVDEEVDEEDVCEYNTYRSRIRLHITLEQVVQLFQGDKDGDNKLHLSIINGLAAVSRFLINIVPEYDWLSYCNLLRQTPLHLAVLTHQSSTVRRLICAGATVLAQDKHGDTPLHIACRLGHVDTVRHLLAPISYRETLENRYDIPYQRSPHDLTVRNYEGQTCLHLATSAGHYRVVKMLLDAGADINSGDGKSGRTVLHLAADRGDVDLVELLLRFKEVNVNKRDYAGLTPLQLACGRKHRNIVHIICSLNHQAIFYGDGEYETENCNTSDCICGGIRRQIVR